MSTHLYKMAIWCMQWVVYDLLHCAHILTPFPSSLKFCNSQSLRLPVYVKIQETLEIGHLIGK